MKNTEQEIIDMERYYETAALEDAIAYFKMKSDQCFNVIKDLINEVKSIIKGICRFFIKPKSNARRIRKSIDLRMICSNTIKQPQLNKNDIIAMDDILKQAQQLLINK